MKRLEGETFEHYQMRRLEDNMKTKKQLKGNLIFQSSDPEWTMNKMRGRTYSKKGYGEIGTPK